MNGVFKFMSNVGLRIFSKVTRTPKALIEGFASILVANTAEPLANHYKEALYVYRY